MAITGTAELTASPAAAPQCLSGHLSTPGSGLCKASLGHTWLSRVYPGSVADPSTGWESGLCSHQSFGALLRAAEKTLQAHRLAL